MSEMMFDNPNEVIVGPRGMGGNPGTPEREKEYIRLEEPLEFKATGTTKVTTLLELSKEISKFFKFVFKDADGVYIQPDQTGKLMATLYLSPKGNDNVEAIGSSTNQNRGSLPNAERIMQHSISLGGRKLKLSDRTKELLEAYIELPYGSKSVNWEQITCDRISQEGFNNSKLYIQVNNISVEKVLKTLYGAKDEDSRYDYAVDVRRALSMMQPGFTNFIVSIQRVDRNAIDELLKTAGMMPSASSIPMI